MAPRMKRDADKAMKHLGVLKSSEERTNFETIWQAAADFCCPENSDITTVTAKGGRKKITRLTDVGIEARRGFARGMYSWAIGDRNFFQATADDPDVMKDAEAKKWFAEATRIAHDEMARSNFAAAALEMFGDLSDIGTSSTFTDWVNGSLNYRTLHISRYWIDQDAKGNVNTVAFELEMTASQLADEFGITELPEKIRKYAADPSKRTMYKVAGYAARNPDYKEGSILQHRRKYTIDYILQKSAGTKEHVVLRTDGFDSFPIAVARLYRAKGEMYGRSCYMECSQSLQLSNDQEYAIIRGAQEKSSPMWVESSDAQVRIVKTAGYTRMIYDPTAVGGPPQQMPSAADVGINEAMLQRTEDRVKKAFLLDAFNPILDHRNMTKYETAQRIGIGLSAVTPPLNKWAVEYATPLLYRTFNLLLQKGRLPPMPPSLEGQSFKFVFTSKAALALREVELNNTQAFLSDQIEISNGTGNPEILDNIDFDAACRLEHEVYSVPGNIIRDPKAVQGIRSARAEQMAQQEQMAQIPAMADAAQKVSQIQK